MFVDYGIFVSIITGINFLYHIYINPFVTNFDVLKSSLFVVPSSITMYEAILQTNRTYTKDVIFSAIYSCTKYSQNYMIAKLGLPQVYTIFDYGTFYMIFHVFGYFVESLIVNGYLTYRQKLFK